MVARRIVPTIATSSTADKVHRSSSAKALAKISRDNIAPLIAKRQNATPTRRIFGLDDCWNARNAIAASTSEKTSRSAYRRAEIIAASSHRA